MKSLNPKLVLDPTWICQAHKVDLEYYTYLLMGAQQTYLKNLEMGKFDNFYEIAFHYLNLNTVIADSMIYDSGLKPVLGNNNLTNLLEMLAQKDETLGREIIKQTSQILTDSMQVYLNRLIQGLEDIHFYFNNSWIHQRDRIYFVCKTVEPDTYEIVKLFLRSTRNLGYSVSTVATVNLPDLKENEFRARLLEVVPIIKDFNSDLNVMVIGGGLNLDPVNRVFLAKDTILLNRVMNFRHGFDANVILDFHRLLEKQKSIPFKLKAK